MGIFQEGVVSEKIHEEHEAFRDEATAVRTEIARLMQSVKAAERVLSEKATNLLLDTAKEELQALGFTVRRDSRDLEAEHDGRVSYDFAIDSNQIEISKRQLPTERFILKYRFHDSPPLRKTLTELDDLALDEASLEEDRQELRYWKRVSEELPKATPTYVAQWPDARHREFTSLDQLFEFIFRDNWSSQQ